MKIKKLALIIVLALAVALFAFGTVFAQTGTASNPVPTTIADILANPVADQVVTLTGEITQVIEGNEFILTDSTGSIPVDGGPDWFQQLGLAAGQPVTVTGEVDLGRTDEAPAAPEIDVFAFESGGQTTIVRQEGGPPPWAGGPHRQGNPGIDDDNDND